MNPNESYSSKELAIQEFNSLRGRLCTVIESADLPRKQEKALVVLIKQTSYQSQAVISELIENLDDSEKKFEYVTQKVKTAND